MSLGYGATSRHIRVCVRVCVCMHTRGSLTRSGHIVTYMKLQLDQVNIVRQCPEHKAPLTDTFILTYVRLFGPNRYILYDMQCTHVLHTSPTEIVENTPCASYGSPHFFFVMIILGVHGTQCLAIFQRLDEASYKVNSTRFLDMTLILIYVRIGIQGIQGFLPIPRL